MKESNKTFTFQANGINPIINLKNFLDKEEKKIIKKQLKTPVAEITEDKRNEKEKFIDSIFKEVVKNDPVKPVKSKKIKKKEVLSDGTIIQITVEAPSVKIKDERLDAIKNIVSSSLSNKNNENIFYDVIDYITTNFKNLKNIYKIDKGVEENFGDAVYYKYTQNIRPLLKNLNENFSITHQLFISKPSTSLNFELKETLGEVKSISFEDLKDLKNKTTDEKNYF